MNETKPRGKGILSMLKASVKKMSSGCGPECGCHADEGNGKQNADEKASGKERERSDDNG